jgi:autophagy-related protein 2
VSIKVIDGSFHAMGPNNPGAMVAYVGELDLSTDLVGDSQETLISTNILNSRVFFIDDKGTCTVPVEKVSVTPGSATDYWKVCYFRSQANSSY